MTHRYDTIYSRDICLQLIREAKRNDDRQNTFNYLNIKI